MRTRTTLVTIALLAVVLLLGAMNPSGFSPLGRSAVYAAPPPPIISLLKQADGTVFEARAYGDEWYSGVETVDGHTILFDERTQNWVYAWKGPDGSLNRSSLVVGKDRPVDIPRHLRSASELIASQRPAFLTQRSRPGGGGNIGAQPMLVLLVDFTDRSPVGTTAYDWREQIFGNSNSVTHYYKEVSYDKFNFTPAAESHGTPNDGIVGWLHVPYAHPNSGWTPGTPDQQLAKDAILAADTYVDFAAFDGNSDGYISRDELHLVLVVAGYEAGYYQADAPACTPSIRGTAWSLDGTVSPPVVDGKTILSWSGGGGYTQFGEWHCHLSDTPGHAATLGIMVHEIGHDLDWPDLYDADYSSIGVGYWSVMGHGMWLYTGSYLGDSPAHPDVWSKWYQGWLTPVKVSGSVEGASIPQIETTPMAYQLLDNPGGIDWYFNNRFGTGEYFLVENRQKVGYDAGLPGCGLLIWHIDETRPYDNTANADESRKLVDLEEADGRNDLDHNTNWGDSGDPYPGDSSNRTFDDASTPNSRLYSGMPSKVSVTDISDAGATMTADMAAPTPCENILSHGDFEAGLLPPWGTAGSTQVTTAHAHGGAHSARLGGANNAVDELFAGVELPPDATSITLSYWWYVESTDPDPQADLLTVVVGGPGGEVVVETLTNSSPRDAWHQTTFDLSSYAGQQVGVMFHSETNQADPTSFYLDDVEVQVCGGATPGRRVYLPLILKGG